MLPLPMCGRYTLTINLVPAYQENSNRRNRRPIHPPNGALAPSRAFPAEGWVPTSFAQ